MALVFEETFQSGIPAGFASVGISSGSLSVTYDGVAKAARLVKDNFNAAWILNNAPAIIETRLEIDVEIVAGSSSHIGMFLTPTSNGLNGIVTALSTVTATANWYTASSLWGFTTISEDLGGENFLSQGVRTVFRFDSWIDAGQRCTAVYMDNELMCTWETTTTPPGGTNLNQPMIPSILVRSVTALIRRVTVYDEADKVWPGYTWIRIRPPKISPAVFFTGLPLAPTTGNKIFPTNFIQKNILYRESTNKVSGKISSPDFLIRPNRVKISAINGDVVQEVITDAQGYYEFTNLRNDYKNFTVSYDRGDGVFTSVPRAQYVGDGKLQGFYKIKDRPVEGTIVRVFAEETDEYLGEVTTNSIGAFLVPNLDKTKKFYLVFRDPYGLWEDRVSSRRTPV